MRDLLKKYCSFKGRARRKEYNYFLLSMMGITILLAAVSGGMSYVFKTTSGGAVGTLMLILIIGIMLLMFYAYIATMARRFHDHNMSAWYVLLLPLALTVVTVLIMVLELMVFKITPVISAVFSFVANIAFTLFLMAKRGTVGPNRFGSDPLEQ